MDLLPFLDEEETAEEEKDSTKVIKSKEVVAAEKAYKSFHIDRNKTANQKSGGRGGGGAGRGGGCGKGNGKGKGKGKGRGKGGLNGVAAGGGVGKPCKPRNGGCHRCGGPHFMRACTVPIQLVQPYSLFIFCAVRAWEP